MNGISRLEQGLQNWLSRLAKGENPFAYITDEQITEIHALAYQLYSQSHYQEAADLYRILALARPIEAKFWKGFGASLQMLKEFEEALNCYANCQRLNGSKPDPLLYVHAADCHFALNQVEEGLAALEAAKAWASKPNKQPILAHVAFMKKQWIKIKG